MRWSLDRRGAAIGRDIKGSNGESDGTVGHRNCLREHHPGLMRSRDMYWWVTDGEGHHYATTLRFRERL